MALRSRPKAVVFDAREDSAIALDACRRLKGDAYTAIIPALVLLADGTPVTAAFSAGADEVCRVRDDPADVAARLRALVSRSLRDVSVHPSTRLPGANAIEIEIAERLGRASFAACYADLDHFKEFNDRYSYAEGDRVIRMVATLLHDVVRGMCGEAGFVGHIGGDDFVFVIPAAAVEPVCEEITSTFDLLVAQQYSEHDRRAGYFFGKDRRGQLHRVPLMTLSIGVVTNERRKFNSAAHVSELVAEMKTYAKTLPGSVFSVDRRTDDRPEVPDSALERLAAATSNRGES